MHPGNHEPFTGFQRESRASYKKSQMCSFVSICPAKCPGDAGSHQFPLLPRALARCSRQHWVQPQLHQSPRWDCCALGKAGTKALHLLLMGHGSIFCLWAMIDACSTVWVLGRLVLHILPVLGANHFVAPNLA